VVALTWLIGIEARQNQPIVVGSAIDAPGRHHGLGSGCIKTETERGTLRFSGREVLGEFPTHDDDTVIALELIRAAQGRDVQPSDEWPIWGVDVARHGDDATALVKRQGNTLLEIPKPWRKLDGNQIAGRIIEEYRKTPKDMQPWRINLDTIGLGLAPFDALRREGSPVRHLVEGVNVGEKPGTSDRDRRLKDELWFRGRQWFEGRNCCIPAELAKSREDEQLLERLILELSQVTFDFTDAGLRVVERKADMKRRLGHSPDLADAFLLTFEGGESRRPIAERYRSLYDDEDDFDRTSAWDA
jgi:hypothetical protein